MDTERVLQVGREAHDLVRGAFDEYRAGLPLPDWLCLKLAQVRQCLGGRAVRMCLAEGPEDSLVIEYGPGRGGLTAELSRWQGPEVRKIWLVTTPNGPATLEETCYDAGEGRVHNRQTAVLGTPDLPGLDTPSGGPLDTRSVHNLLWALDGRVRRGWES